VSRTVKRIFKRFHESGLLIDHKPEDYEFYRHSVTRTDREAGAMLWSMIHKRSHGPIITSMFSVNECTAGCVEECRGFWSVNEVEIQPKY